MSHHIFSPSSFPAWTKCIHYETDQTGLDGENSPAFRGTLQHKELEYQIGLADKKGGRDITKRSEFHEKLTSEERNNVDFAFFKIMSILASYNLGIKDAETEVEVLAFTSDMTAVTGTADVLAVKGDTVIVIDYKSGVERDFEAQLKVYGLGAMQAYDCKKVDIYAVYGREKKATSNTFELEETQKFFDEMVYKLSNREEFEPEVNSYCGWCTKRLSCKARNKSLTESKKVIPEGKELLKGITVKTDISKLSPEKLGGLVAYAKLLEDWAKDLKAIAEAKLAEDENAVAGWGLKFGSPRVKIDAVKAEEIALERYGVEPYELAKVSSLSKSALMKAVYGKEANKKATKEEFNEVFKDAISEGKTPKPSLVKKKEN